MKAILWKQKKHALHHGLFGKNNIFKKHPKKVTLNDVYSVRYVNGIENIFWIKPKAPEIPLKQLFIKKELFLFVNKCRSASKWQWYVSRIKKFLLKLKIYKRKLLVLLPSKYRFRFFKRWYLKYKKYFKYYQYGLKYYRHKLHVSMCTRMRVQQDIFLQQQQAYMCYYKWMRCTLLKKYKKFLSFSWRKFLKNSMLSVNKNSKYISFIIKVNQIYKNIYKLNAYESNVQQLKYARFIRKKFPKYCDEIDVKKKYIYKYRNPFYWNKKAYTSIKKIVHKSCVNINRCEKMSKIWN